MVFDFSGIEAALYFQLLAPCWVFRHVLRLIRQYIYLYRFRMASPGAQRFALEPYKTRLYQTQICACHITRFNSVRGVVYQHAFWLTPSLSIEDCFCNLFSPLRLSNLKIDKTKFSIIISSCILPFPSNITVCINASHHPVSGESPRAGP